MSLEQLRLWIDEQVAALKARRARGDNPDYDLVRPRKLDRWEVRLLALAEEERERLSEMDEVKW